MNLAVNLDVETAVQAIREMDAEITEDDNGRYRSWEHCYKIFERNRNHGGDEQVLDLLCIHLAFYLASWGMYRGSSFLLQKDYKVHLEPVKVITGDKYQRLWNLKATDILDDDTVNLIFDVKERLNTIYSPIKKAVKPKIKSTETSDTLITKIMMGTFGCVPAYDNYFQRGVRMYNSAVKFSRTSIQSLAEFYLGHEQEFEHVRADISDKHGVEYPQMKLIDMCFWQIGMGTK